ncbi:dynamin family protein [Pseudomonas aegrilactucae]|uniref:Dynamin family protein n=1 Tax=Pseudomonas aegrilactucae TaxID=2854028 RepID=A0A9Q2XIJ8_9PSED|nr:dynamin family protein [Pseudomonas aegrilactucae]MBV6287671.1 dynamin family protein [Pseudomonas aegrilactucae]
MLNTQRTYLAYLKSIPPLMAETSISVDEVTTLQGDIQHTELLVPVIGAYSAGKSSLLNAFLGENALGVGLAPETELATELRYSSAPHLLAVRANGTSERLAVEDLATIKARAGEFTHLQLYLDNPRLKALPSLVLVDMPGFGSSLGNHNKAIAYYLPRGVHFIVVTSVEDGNITQSMLRQLDDLQTYGRDFTFLLNKVNLRADDEVQDVAELIDEQISLNFADTRPLLRIGLDGDKRLGEVLAGLQPEEIVRQVFEDRLKDLTHGLLNQINLALTALKKNQAENEHALSELTHAVRQIERKRDGILEDLRDRQLDQAVDNCLDVVGRELDNAQSELVNAGLAGNQEAFSRIVSEVVRGSMTRTIKEQMDLLSRTVVSDFAQTVGDLGKSMGQFSNDPNWLEQLTGRINRSLQKTGETLGHWSKSLAARNGNELERLKQETGWKEGNPLPRVSYQGLATVLAVTTSVVNPLIELAIIFLPQILSFFNEGRQRDQLRQKVTNEIIPSVKRELRDRLPALLAEQMDVLVTQVGAEFGHEIGEKQKLIDELVTTRNQDAEAAGHQIALLSSAREQLQQLAKQALYEPRQ